MVFICVLVIHMTKISMIMDKKSSYLSSTCYRTRVICIIITIVLSNIYARLGVFKELEVQGSLRVQLDQARVGQARLEPFLKGSGHMLHFRPYPT